MGIEPPRGREIGPPTRERFRPSSVSNRLSELSTATRMGRFGLNMRFCALATAPRRGSLNDVDEPRHEIVVPAWRMLPSGLIVPSSVADRLESGRPEIAVPPELTLSPAPVAVVEQLPVSADQMGGAINEEELGLPPADLDELIAKVPELPFEHAFLLIARIAAAVWHMREDAERQLELVRTFKMPTSSTAWNGSCRCATAARAGSSSRSSI
jgi:hypothetical protein